MNATGAILYLSKLNCSLQPHSRVSAENEASGDTSSRTGHPTLFFNTRKRDGVPLSTSIVSWIERLKAFKFFESVSHDLLVPCKS
jgi:hypothetical protein